MTRPRVEVEQARELHLAGLSEAAVALRSGIPRRTLNDWKRQGLLALDAPLRRTTRDDDGVCTHIAELPGAEYAYLLGMYLGDGMLTLLPRGVYKLRIVLDAKYPLIIAECRRAMEAVLPNRVGLAHRPGCVELFSHSMHWRCLFPQHGPGRKHLRTITLQPWQFRTALQDKPEALLRGLIHSDGCRVLNVVKGRPYARYHFTNNSDDIRGIFVAACHRIDVTCRHHNWKGVSVARRNSVARLDEFIGPKA